MYDFCRNAVLTYLLGDETTCVGDRVDLKLRQRQKRDLNVLRVSTRETQMQLNSRYTNGGDNLRRSYIIGLNANNGSDRLRIVSMH